MTGCEANKNKCRNKDHYSLANLRTGGGVTTLTCYIVIVCSLATWQQSPPYWIGASTMLSSLS